MNRFAITKTRLFLGISACILLMGVGCDRQDAPTNQAVKKPRPVEVGTLTLGLPPDSAWVTASVGSWKTEDIGFEVSGRIKSVKEPNEEVEGRVYALPEDEAPTETADDDVREALQSIASQADARSQPITDIEGTGEIDVPGTPIAEIEDERYQLQLDSALAEVDRARQMVIVAETEETVLDEQIKARVAKRVLAKNELERRQTLLGQNAVSEAEVDSAQADFDIANAEYEQLKASKIAQQAEVASLKLAVQKAIQAARDAKRDLDDCTLYSSFNGQIAEVFVVPGSVVSVGQPVAKVQMMNPIKIEFEVSAADALRLRKRQRLPLLVTNAEGELVDNEGFLYLIDPVADPQTRTYTLTLLMINEKNVASMADSDLPVTNQAWRVDFPFLPGAEQGKTYVPQPTIREDADGYFLWRITNFKRNQPLPPGNLIKVSKLRIRKGDARVPFLGNWVFQEIIIEDPTFDPQVNLVAGKLSVKQGDPDDWNGDTILVDRGNSWMVRPGDLVKVDLSNSQQTPGYFVPMNAIVQEDGSYYLFVIEPNEPGSTDRDSKNPVARVRKTEIVMSGGSESNQTPQTVTSSFRRILPAVDDVTLDGKQYVARGAHYLRDGENVRITRQAGGRQ